MKGTGGWSEKLADDFLDERKRLRFESASDPEMAVKLLISKIEEKRK
jgi:predicted nucleic acid-binding OB-fold protein